MKIYREPPLYFKSKTDCLEKIEIESLIRCIHSEAMKKIFNKLLINDKLTKNGEEFFNRTCTLINIDLSKRLKTSGGNAKTSLVSDYAHISLNYRLFTSTADYRKNPEHIENTYLHELAHVIATRYYRKPCGHSKDWRDIFISLGGNGERCHTMDVSHLRPKRRK